jgi:hypothetical protein
VRGDSSAALARATARRNRARGNLIPIKRSPVLWLSAMFPISLAPRAACLLLIPALVGLSSCKQGEAGNRQVEVNTQPAANVAQAVPLPQPPMDRAALLQAVAQARSAAAAGADDGDAQKALDAKEFELRIRFGCAGASPTGDEKPPLSWTFDSKSGVLRVRAAPDLSEDADVAKGLEGVEAVEGFWLSRPWLLSAACPAKPVPPISESADGDAAPAGDALAATAVAAGPEVGVAQFFTATDPRTSRRDHRPYQAVEKLEPGASVGTQGFDLVLAGRLRPLPGGRVIRCVASSPDSPPACVISAQFDHVWIDDAATGRRIADWSSS